jgi:eukaryotic-like serine/threonine-protein kinase
MTLLKDRYELHEKLGEGGMAEVYRATHVTLDREVAVKFIKGDLENQQFVDRFEREAKAAARLTHANILHIYDYDFAEDGRPFLVLELLHGEDLARRMLTRKEEIESYSLSEVLQIIRNAAAGLGYAHTQGIIHRDVKPANIFITDDGRTILMDFGIAKMVDADQLTGTGIIVGASHYFAPEQAQGKPVDHRVDIYSLGAVMYELLTGETPFKGDTTMSVIAQHIHADVPDPTLVRPDLPPDITRIIRTAMAKDPADRYADMEAFRNALYAVGNKALRKASISA